MPDDPNQAPVRAIEVRKSSLITPPATQTPARTIDADGGNGEDGEGRTALGGHAGTVSRRPPALRAAPVAAERREQRRELRARLAVRRPPVSPIVVRICST